MKALVFTDRHFTVGSVDPRIYSGFIEHVGRAVYDGIYEPGHPTADADGFRKDVLELVRELKMPLTRYPGGNFVSGYNWKDGIGERSKRPVRPDPAWSAIEPNQVGVDEFVRWCASAESAPLMAVNLGIGTPKEAGELVEYCNFPGGTQWSETRRANGSAEPFRIKTWCLGNEMDGPWQIGAKPADEYGRTALEAAKIMKWIDPEIELVVCGSSSGDLPTFAAWDATVLEHTFDKVDYLSLHAYFGDVNNDLADYFASPDRMSDRIDELAATCDYVSAHKKSKKRINLAFDEWNIWFHSNSSSAQAKRWIVGRPILEELYTLADAVVVGGLLITLLRHADRVKIACLAQTVNVLAPIMTRPGGGTWKQTTYYPFYYTSRYGRGEVLRCAVSVPSQRCNNWPKPVEMLHSTVVWRREENEMVFFAMNRSLEEPMEFSLALQGFPVKEVIEAVEISGDPTAVNTEEHEAVVPKFRDPAEFMLSAGSVSGVLPPISWSMIRIRLNQ